MVSELYYWMIAHVQAEVWMESIVVLFVVKYWRDQIVTVGSYVIITMVSSYLAPDCGNSPDTWEQSLNSQSLYWEPYAEVYIQNQLIARQ